MIFTAFSLLCLSFPCRLCLLSSPSGFTVFIKSPTIYGMNSSPPPAFCHPYTTIHSCPTSKMHKLLMSYPVPCAFVESVSLSVSVVHGPGYMVYGLIDSNSPYPLSLPVSHLSLVVNADTYAPTPLPDSRLQTPYLLRTLLLQTAYSRRNRGELELLVDSLFLNLSAGLVSARCMTG